MFRLIVQTPDAGELGHRLLTSTNPPEPFEQAEAIVRGTYAAATTWWLERSLDNCLPRHLIETNAFGVFNFVTQRDTGREAPQLLVLHGIATDLLSTEEREHLFGVLDNYLEQLPRLVNDGQIQWASAKAHIFHHPTLALWTQQLPGFIGSRYSQALAFQKPKTKRLARTVLEVEVISVILCAIIGGAVGYYLYFKVLHPTSALPPNDSTASPAPDETPAPIDVTKSLAGREQQEIQRETQQQQQQERLQEKQREIQQQHQERLQELQREQQEKQKKQQEAQQKKQNRIDAIMKEARGQENLALYAINVENWKASLRELGADTKLVDELDELLKTKATVRDDELFHPIVEKLKAFRDDTRANGDHLTKECEKYTREPLTKSPYNAIRAKWVRRLIKAIKEWQDDGKPPRVWAKVKAADYKLDQFLKGEKHLELIITMPGNRVLKIDARKKGETPLVLDALQMPIEFHVRWHGTLGVSDGDRKTLDEVLAMTEKVLEAKSTNTRAKVWLEVEKGEVQWIDHLLGEGLELLQQSAANSK